MNTFRNRRKRYLRDRAFANRETQPETFVNTQFTGSVGTVNNYSAMTQNFDMAERSESKTECITMKCTPSQKEMFEKLARERGISNSELARDMFEIFIAVYPHNYEILENSQQFLNLFKQLMDVRYRGSI